MRSDGRTVAAGLVADIRAVAHLSLGVVVGATIDVADYGIALSDLVGIPVLAPGFGAQGAELAASGGRCSVPRRPTPSRTSLGAFSEADPMDWSR